MKDRLKIYSPDDILPLINKREGELKLGEKVQTYRHCEEQLDKAISLEELSKSTAKFVLLGIPEDIGVRANLGIGGTQTAWIPSLKALLNMQSNSFFSGEELLVLGSLEIAEPEDASLTGLRNKVKEIDCLVCSIIAQVIKANKIPIIIGGGHNNAFGIINGASLAYKSPINVVNIDAHADLRKAEGRHSGNGFTYALQNGYLNQYRIFGLQESYVNADLLKEIKNSANIRAFYGDDILKSEKAFLTNWHEFVEDLPEPCGLELDLDSIANVLSSACSPSGFSLNEIRSLLLSCAKNFSYLHICEGATKLADGREDLTTGKTIAFLISDFIKALRPHISQQPSS